MAALIAFGKMAAKGRSSAIQDGAHGCHLYSAQIEMLLAKGSIASAKNVGHLQRWPTHQSFLS